MYKIMFVCTGNTCRSAMAEAMLKKEIVDKKLNLNAYSCGIYAFAGDFASSNAIKVLKEYGIDLSIHRATNIADASLDEMDIILCLTESHKIGIKQMYPNLSKKVYTLKEYVYNNEKNINISDPFGNDIETYKKCAEEIKMCIEILAIKLINNKQN